MSWTRGLRWCAVRAVASLLPLGSILGPTVSAAGRVVPVTAMAVPPTFNTEVAPILFKNCVGCHRPGEIAETSSLLNYASAKPLAQSIRRQVLARKMPPWPADPKHSMAFRNDRRLTDGDVATLVAWVDAGAPRGNESDPPPPPPAATGWLYPTGKPPDAVLSLPEVSVAASGEIPYVLQRVKVPLREDKWIIAMQVRAGNDALVHHMGITEVSMKPGMGPKDLDDLATLARQMGVADDALTDMRPAVADPLNPGTYDMLGVYTPGTTFEMYDHGTAKLLKAGSNLYINFNIHYTTTGKPEKNHSELALWFAPTAPEHALFRAPGAVATLIASGRQLLTDDPGTKAEGTDFPIPPVPRYAENYELIGMTAYTEPMTLYQLQPHAHMRGKDFKYWVVYPDGHEVTVLSVPKYDFHWQLAYDLQTPLVLPAGSKLLVTAHYDNSSHNAHLTALGVDRRTCGPDKEAYFRRQNQSWHEMFSPLVQYSMQADGKPLHFVQAVGCLVPDGTAGWALRHASDPVVSNAQATSAAAVHAAARTPLGSQTYALVGAQVFSPQRQGAGRMVVKGVFIGGSENRLNVTSLQPIGGTCP